MTEAPAVAPRPAAGAPPTDAFEFVAPIERHALGRLAFSVVYLPASLERRLPFDRHPRLRVDAEIGGQRLNGAFQPGGGRRYLILSRRFLRAAGLGPGRRATVRFAVADQSAVEVPKPLAAALARDPSARREWEALPVGERRGLAHRVASARRAPTVARRVDEVLLGLLGPGRRTSAAREEAR